MGEYKLRCVVDEIDNVIDEFDEIEYSRSTTGLVGDRTFLASVPLVAGTTEYYYDDPDGADTYVFWTRYHDTVSDRYSRYDGPLQYGTSALWYVTVEDLRDEGITDAALSDGRAVMLIRQAQSYIDRMTGRHFLPVLKTIKIDSEWGTTLVVPEPIVRINDTVLEELSGSGSAPTEIDYDHTLMRVYNRHLTQGLLTPDDRENPKLVIPPEFWAARVRYGEFKHSRQQMRLTGVFGYTELRPSDDIGETSAGSQIPLAYGRTPPPIQDVMKRLIVRWLSPLGEPEFRRLDELAGRVKSWKTSEQSITYFSGADSGIPYVTGDPAIDQVLLMYSAHNKLSVSFA